MEPTTYHSKKARTKKENSRKQIGLTSEILSTSCGSRKKSLKQNSVIKSSFVLLKNINHGRKKKHNYCLRTPHGKQLAPQTQHKKFAAFRKLQVGLYDILDKNCVPTLKKSLQIPNVGALLEKGKKGTAERGTTEVDSCREAGGCSGELEPGQTNSGCDIRKSGNGAKSSKLLALSDQSLFATFSFIEQNHENTVMDPCRAKTDEERKENFQKVSVPVSDAEKWNTKWFEPTEKCMESGSHVVRDAEEGHACYKAEDGQDVEMKLSGGSSETTIGDVTQLHSLNSISVSDKGVLQNREIIPALSSDAFSKTSISRMILTDEKADQGDQCHVSEPVSSLSEMDLKLGIQTRTSNMSEIKLPVKEMMGLCLNTLTEKIHEDPVILEEEDSNEDVESFCFLLKSNDVRYDEALVCVAYEGNSGNVVYGGGLSDHGAEFLVPEGNLTGQNYPDDEDDGGGGGAFIQTEIKKATMSVEDKEVNFFSNEKETMDCPPAEENISVGEEESLPLCQSRSVKMVFYELFGSLVKLLGSPSVNQKKSRLRKLTELEDSSNAKIREGSDARLSSERKKEDRTMYLDCRTKQKAAQKKTPKPMPRSWLSQEQSRVKVMEALTEALQKRLNVCPDLHVQKNIASKIAKKVEMEIFRHFGCVDRLYKNKYRSLLFNLKSADNQLFHKLMLRKITPRKLVQMSSLEMASKELAEWRAKKNKHELEMIEKEEREMPRRCSEKFTHKGIVEIYREVEIEVASEEIIESSLLEVPSLVGSNQIRELDADNEPASTTNRNRQVAKRSSYSVIWNGLIQMFSVKQFVAKAYPVSGFGSHLSQALPTVLQSQGCILPKDVWAYVDSIWPAKREEMGVIRFRPSLSRDSSSYHTLYAYLNDRQRYGVVESNQMEIFLAPLPAYQLVPPQFHPVGGPGLHRCHPALLLGLILPKRTLLDSLKTSHDLPRTAKKKRVTSKVNPKNSRFTLPSRLQVDVGQEQSPRPLCTEGLSPGEGLTSLPKQEELTVDSLLDLIEQLKREIVCRVPSTSCQQDARDEVNQPFLTADSASTGEQLGNLTLGILGAPPCQNKEEIQFFVDPPPSDFCSLLGPLLPSGVLHPDQHGTHVACGAQGINTFENLLLPSVFCAEAVTPVEESQAQLSPQIPYTNTIGEHNPSVQETLSLIQTMMQSNIQNLEAQSCSLLTQEMISALSQIPAGTESFPVQQDGGHYIGPT
ncbi:SPOC domain-containing protein 1 isoform 4-T4 [Vipera latastei]